MRDNVLYTTFRLGESLVIWSILMAVLELLPSWITWLPIFILTFVALAFGDSWFGFELTDNGPRRTDGVRWGTVFVTTLLITLAGLLDFGPWWAWLAVTTIILFCIDLVPGLFADTYVRYGP